MNGRTRAELRPLVVAEHGLTCHLCHHPIPTDVHHQHPMALVLDHLTPVADGGTDDLENLRPAHRRCNLLRGAAPLPTPTTDAPPRLPSAAAFFKPTVTLPQISGSVSPPAPTKTVPQDEPELFDPSRWLA